MGIARSVFFRAVRAVHDSVIQARCQCASCTPQAPEARRKITYPADNTPNTHTHLTHTSSQNTLTNLNWSQGLGDESDLANGLVMEKAMNQPSVELTNTETKKTNVLGRNEAGRQAGTALPGSWTVCIDPAYR